jgi:hypothetical protein
VLCCVQVDAAIIPFYLRLQVLQDLGMYDIPTAGMLAEDRATAVRASGRY